MILRWMWSYNAAVWCKFHCMQPMPDTASALTKVTAGSAPDLYHCCSLVVMCICPKWFCIDKSKAIQVSGRHYKRSHTADCWQRSTHTLLLLTCPDTRLPNMVSYGQVIGRGVVGWPGKYNKMSCCLTLRV